MHLSRVVIKNYRSIRDLTITFDPACRILVGINESGKTNILDALNLLDPAVVPTQRDVREPSILEDPVTEAHVWFIFGFTREEVSSLVDEVRKKVLSNSYESPVVRIGGTDYTVDRFCETREGLYTTDVLQREKDSSFWDLDNAHIINKWKKVASTCPPDFELSSASGPIKLKGFVLVNASEFPSIPAEYLEEAKPQDLNETTGEAIEQIVASNLPKVLFWNYDEKNLLPPRVNLDQFCAKPDSCIPLKRMFQLYKVTDINGTVAFAKQAGANSLNNLLRRVADRTSKHFHDT